MKLKQIYKVFFLVFAIALSESFAQEKSQLTESNLPNKTEEIAPEESASAPSSSTNSLINQAKSGLAETLLGKNKTSSLMFDDQESENLERAVESLKNNQAFIPEGSDEDPTLNNGLSEKEKAEEAEKIRKAEELKNLENEKSYIYMASIIYFNPKDWIVWINDKKITSKTNDSKKELFIESIKKDRVKILWKLSLSKWKIISGKREEFAPPVNAENQIEIHFELKPNQTFVLSSSKVVEGKALIALQKKKEEVLAPKP
ncbi:MAG: hypothetical protein KA100_04180 [Rickettsiales bacterium]|nr:hypothetical protein [Rickettsiales bacterium]